MVAGTHLNVTLYVQCLSHFFYIALVAENTQYQVRWKMLVFIIKRLKSSS